MSRQKPDASVDPGNRALTPTMAIGVWFGSAGHSAWRDQLFVADRGFPSFFICVEPGVFDSSQSIPAFAEMTTGLEALSRFRFTRVASA